MSPLTREASSEARQYGELSIVPCPIVKSATSTSGADRMTSAGADARFAPVTPAVAMSHLGVAGRPARVRHRAARGVQPQRHANQQHLGAVAGVVSASVLRPQYNDRR
jgi:hypothetical protein